MFCWVRFSRVLGPALRASSCTCGSEFAGIESAPTVRGPHQKKAMKTGDRMKILHRADQLEILARAKCGLIAHPVEADCPLPLPRPLRLLLVRQQGTGRGPLPA